MTRTMFDSRGFRPGASTLGHGHVMPMSAQMGERIADVWKKYSQAYLNPVPQLKVTPAVTVPPEPTILGIPQKTALVGAAAVVGIGILASIFG